ncbi:hypothetical protein BDZ89DRAFT_338246 [Hymenopellis radicata]|nr:hypothetical protein BDZ89DRAFT_338246 [Hymenopellis radicata]
MPKHALYPSDDEHSTTTDSSESESTRPPPFRRRRTLAGGVPEPKKPTGPKRSLPEAGPFNPHYVVSSRRAGRDRVVKDLNLLQNYGDYWPREAGLRELVQNMWDGCMQFCHGSPDDIAVSVVHKDKEGPSHAFDWGILDPSWSQHLELGETITVVFRVKGHLDPPPLPQPGGPVPAGQLGRKGDCGIWSDSRLLGWLGLRAAARNTFEIELFDIHEPLTLSKMRFGATTKAKSRVLVGQHGDGLKMGINAIIREGTANGGLVPNLSCFTGTKQWEFEYNEVQDLSLEVIETVANTPFVPGVLTRIVDFPRDIVDLGHFLFIRPPQKCLTTARGSILRDTHLSSRIYIKNFYVSVDNDLAYGVNLQDASLTRDRNSMYGDISSDLSPYVYNIWAANFRSNAESMDLYLELLLGKKSSVDVKHAEGEGWSPMDVDDVKLLWTRLQATKGGGDVFFCSENPEDIRITQDVLRKTPFPIHDRFHSHLRRHRLIQSPQAARSAKFLNLAASPIIAQPTLQVRYTLHLLASFLASESEMARYRDAYRFQAVPHTLDSIEVDKVDKVDGEVLLINDCTLSSEFVHLKCGMCPYYRRHLHARGETEPQSGDISKLFDDHRFPDVDAEHICHCSALHILSLITQENSR